MNNRGVKASPTDIAAFLAIMLMPWQARWIFAYHELAGQRYEYGVYSVYAASIVLIIACFFVLRREPLKFSFPMKVFLGWLVINLAIAAEFGVALWYLVTGILAFGYYVVASRWERRKVMLSIVAAGLLQAVFAWWQFIGQGIMASTFLGVAEHLPRVLGQSVVVVHGLRTLRAYGLLPHPNMLGGLLLISFALLLYLYARQYERRNFEKQRALWAAYVAGCLLLFSGILITFSKAAILGVGIFFIGWVTDAIVRRRKEILKPFGEVAFSAALLFIVFNMIAAGAWTERFGLHFGTSAQSSEQIRLEQKSADERIADYHMAQVLLNVRTLVVGVGLGNYIPRLAQAFPALAAFQYQPVHNIFAMAVLEIGVVGLIFFLWWIVWLLKGALLRFREYDQQYLFSLIVLLLLLGMVDHYLWTSYFGQSLWWAVIGLAVGKRELT
ncbi:MAG: O-antigen ligase family protein [Patescibacteria group bacterium]